MQPLVLIAANPYEGELCRRALRETGIEVEPIESIESAMHRIRERTPLCVVIADGWVHADARELLVEVRSEHEKIPIFLVEPRDSDIADEATAVRRGATRLFLRPIEPQLLADAIESLAVEAEMIEEVSVVIDDQRQAAGGAPAIEMVAEPSRGDSGDWPQVPIPRVITEVVGPPKEPSLGEAPPSAALPRIEAPPMDLLRADDALSSDFVIKVEARDEPPKERSDFARRLDRELSEAEKRLFPGSAASTPAYPDEDDALGDIDLDRIGLDTMPGLLLEVEEVGHKNGSSLVEAAPAPAPAPAPAHAHAPMKEEGALADEDLAELLFALHAMGWTGKVTLSRGEAEKAIFFDAGAPVFATSSLLHDRLGDLLWREGKLSREQHARTRELASPPGRRTAQALVELGLVKSAEVFPTLRRHVEEIVWSCFSWDTGTFRLTPEAPASEDRLRLSQPPLALFLEGIRRKYGLERLVERVGPTDLVLVPTTALADLRADGGLSPSEQVALELFDGERTLGDLQLALAGVPGVSLGETALYALAWGLLCAGAVRRADDPTDRLGIPSVATLVTAGVERRAQPREGERDAGLSIDRERVAAKRAQLDDCDYFGALGLERSATPHEIERAWDRLRQDFAPERFSEMLRSELGDALVEIRTVLDEAHRILMDDRVREAYRSHLAE